MDTPWWKINQRMARVFTFPGRHLAASGPQHLVTGMPWGHQSASGPAHSPHPAAPGTVSRQNAAHMQPVGDAGHCRNPHMGGRYSAK